MNILITGTSSGLGFGLAGYYLEQGHKVYGISRKVNSSLKSNPNFNLLPQNLTMFREVEINLYSFLKDVNKLDLVILNAGILNEIKDLKDTPLNEIKKTMDVNVWANKILIEALFNQGKEIDQIVAISSGASVSGARGWNAYSLSKATLNMLIDLYAREFTKTHFCALAPGLIDTNMQDYIYSLEEQEKFPVVQKLQSAKGTEKMPPPDKAAKIVARGIEKALAYESGSFLDVRNM
jgi:NAD(P)-dependent dehydrogenase (short-subunit alcohol dehydrogenase family)